MEWIQLALVEDFCESNNKSSGSIKIVEFLESEAIISFSRRTLPTETIRTVIWLGVRESEHILCNLHLRLLTVFGRTMLGKD